MSTPSVQRSTSDVVVPTTSTPPEKFEVPGGRRETPSQETAPAERAPTPLLPKNSFQKLEEWNKSEQRKQVDQLIAQAEAGGPKLTPQQRELVRRQAALATQMGPFDAEKAAPAVKAFVDALRGPDGDGAAVQMYAMQARAFGGMYVEDKYKPAVEALLRGEPSPEAPVVPEGDETETADVPVDTQETPAEGEAAPVESKPTPTASRSGAKTAKEVLTDEWAKLSAGKDAIVLAAMMPILEKTGIPKESEPKVADLLRQQGIDPGKITQPQYMQARVELLRMALTRMASQQNPNASPEEIAGMVNGRLEVALNQTTI